MIKVKNKDNFQLLNNGNIFYIDNLEEIFLSNKTENNKKNKYQKHKQYKEKLEKKYGYYYGYYSYPYQEKIQDNKEYIIYIKHDSKISRFYKKVSNKTIRRKGKIDIKDLSEDNSLNEYKYENLFLDKFKCHKLYDYWWRVL